MGGSESKQPLPAKKEESLPSNSGLLLLGSTLKGPVLLNYIHNNIQIISSPIQFPKYAHSFSSSVGIGYMTGGVEQLQSATISLTASSKQFQGIVSKKCTRISVAKLFVDIEHAFEPMADMINGRYAHCAIEFNNNIYAIGGREYGDDDIGILSACEKFDSQSKQWKQIPSLGYRRSGAVCLTYADRIYVFGGYTGNRTRSRVIEVYSEGDTAWRQLAYRLHEGIEGCLVVPNPQLPTSIYIFGGKTESCRTNAVVEVNFDRETVQHCNPLRESRSFHKGSLENGGVHIIGGGTDIAETYNLTTGTSQIDQQISYLDYCTAEQLSAMSALNPQISLHTSQQLPAKNVLTPQISLHSNTENPLHKVYMFGHAKQPFTKILDMDTLTMHSEGQSLHHNFYKFPTVVRVNKFTVFIMGGISPDCTEVTDTVYSFDLNSQEIKYLQPMSLPKYGFSAAVRGSYLYICGGRKLGEDQTAILTSCERFSFQNYQWENIASLKHKRHSSMSLAVNNQLMVIGGYKGNGVCSNDIEMYIEDQNRWVQLESKFELAAQAMTPVVNGNDVYLFGGRTEYADISKVFKLDVIFEPDKAIKSEKLVHLYLEPVGDLSQAGTNLKVFKGHNKGLVYVFGNVQNAIDIYDLKINKIVEIYKLPIQHIGDPLFQNYFMVF